MSGLEPLRWLWTACLHHVVMNSFSWTASHPGSRTSVYFTTQYLFTTEQLFPTIQQISLRWIDPPLEENPPKVPTNARPLLFPYLCYAKNNYQPQLSRLLPRFNPNASIKVSVGFLWLHERRKVNRSSSSGWPAHYTVSHKSSCSLLWT